MSNKNRKPKNTKRASGTIVQRRAEPYDMRKAHTVLVLKKSTEHVARYRQWLTKQQDACAKTEELLDLVLGPTVGGKPMPALIETLGVAFRALDEYYVRNARGEKLEGDEDIENDLGSLIDSAVCHIGNSALETCVIETFRAATVPTLNHETMTSRIEAVSERAEKLATSLERI